MAFHRIIKPAPVRLFTPRLDALQPGNAGDVARVVQGPLRIQAITGRVNNTAGGPAIVYFRLTPRGGAPIYTNITTIAAGTWRYFAVAPNLPLDAGSDQLPMTVPLPDITFAQEVEILFHANVTVEWDLLGVYLLTAARR